MGVAISLSCNDAQVHGLLSRLGSHLIAGHAGVARPLFNAVRRLAPDAAVLAELEVRLLLLEGRDGEARQVADAAIDSRPDSADLRLCRAELRRQGGDFTGAAADAADAVILRPDWAMAHAALGQALLRLGRHGEALVCLREAATAEPANHATCLALAQALDSCGDEQGASAVLEAGIARMPQQVTLRVMAILLRLYRHEFAAAEALAEASRQAGNANACVFGLLGHARSSLGRHDEAAEAYAEARKLGPEDPYVRHLAAAAGLSADAGRASADYVRVVFDGYAARFDDHLIFLGYRVPGLLRLELQQFDGGDAPAVLDLGCGTGLAALALSDLQLGDIVGVDLSAEMLAVAARRNLYRELHRQDIEQFLAIDIRQFPLVLAADVLPYFGDLTPLLRLIARRLSGAGQFLFSVECAQHDDPYSPGWRLGRLGRYVHTRQHVREAAEAAGLQMLFLRDEQVRREGGAPVPGLFVGLTRAIT